MSDKQLEKANKFLIDRCNALEKEVFTAVEERKLWQERAEVLSLALARISRDFTVLQGREQGLRRIIEKQSNISAWLEQSLEEMLQD